MSQPRTPAIRRLVDHHGGLSAFTRLVDGLHYQEVQRWLARDWASPKQFLRLEPLLPKGMSIRDLYADIEEAKSHEKAA